MLAKHWKQWKVRTHRSHFRTRAACCCDALPRWRRNSGKRRMSLASHNFTCMCTVYIYVYMYYIYIYMLPPIDLCFSVCLKASMLSKVLNLEALPETVVESIYFASMFPSQELLRAPFLNGKSESCSLSQQQIRKLLYLLMRNKRAFFIRQQDLEVGLHLLYPFVEAINLICFKLEN